jgi:hypothetical protein
VVATVGAAFVTVTLALPLTLPLVAVTVAFPEAYDAVYRPELFTEPHPTFDQVTVVDIAPPNWSAPLAVNCCVSWDDNVTLAGDTPIEVNVWLTVTLTLLVVLSPPASVMVTASV